LLLWIHIIQDMQTVMFHSYYINVNFIY
jgi:hypothetical protein